MNKKIYIILFILLIVLVAGCSKKEKMICTEMENEEKNELIFKFKNGKVIKLENIYTFSNETDANDAYFELGKTAIDGSKYELDGLKVSYTMSEDELEFYKTMSKEEIRKFVEDKNFECK